MKLLVSDYDKTIEVEGIFRKDHIPKGTISGIEKFMNDGNLFMIATARPYESIMYEVERYGIPYNFISSLNGCIVHDNNKEVVYSKDTISLNLKKLRKLYSCIEKIETIKDKDKVLYYTFKTKLFTSSKRLIQRLESRGFDVQSWLMNTYSIAHAESNKVDSIEFIQERYNISDSDVIVVGDSNDDLQMIEDYFSYGIIKPLPNADVMAECNVKVKSLKEALKHINKNI